MKIKLTKQQRKELAYKKYEKAIKPALEKYEKAENLAFKKYKKVEKLAKNEYEKVGEPALKKYKKEIEKIDAEPDEIPEIIEKNGRKYKLIEEEK